MTRTKNQIKEYFRDYIYGFIFNDIRNCIKAKANYTVALALLSYTDYLGGLINGTLGLQNKSKDQFNKALEYFEWKGDQNYYKNFKIRFKDIDFTSKEGDIYSLFRCGLAHEYFIKGDSLVHNNPDGYTDEKGKYYCDGCIDEDAGVQIINEGNKKRLRLHNNAYFRDFEKAWEKYYNELVEKENKDLLKNFNNALDRIAVREIEF